MPISVKKIAGITQSTAKNIGGVSNSIGQEVDFIFNNDASLVHYWRLEGNSTDKITGVAGTDTDVTYSEANGKFGRGAGMNGSTSRITTSWSFTPTEFTVSFWLYPTTASNYNHQIGSSTAWGAFYFHANTGGSVWCGTDVTNRFSPTELPAGTLTLNDWNHIVFTYKGGYGKFYKNGYCIACKSGMSNPSNWNGFQIGSGNTDTVNGKVDDVAIFNRALTADEVGRLYDPSIHKIVSATSSWKPTDISGCKVWIDPSRLNLNYGDDVTGITDMSGNGANLSQRTVSQNPHYKILGIGYKPTMEHTASATSTWDIPWTYSAPNTFFYAGKMGTTKSRMFTAKNNNWLMGYWGGYENQYYAEGWVGANSDLAATTKDYVWSAITDTTSKLWKNGVLVKSGSGGTTAPSGLDFGNGEWSDGQIGEIIGYNRALSDAERIEVETYLTNKWLKYGDGYYNPGTSAVDIRNKRPDVTTGWYWIKTDAMSVPVQVWCNYDWHGGGWMRLNSSIATLSSPKGSSPYFYTDGGTWNDAVIGNNVPSGCGNGTIVCQVDCNKLGHTEALVLIWRESTIIQCMGFNGATATGYWNGSYHAYGGSYTALSFCNWGDGLWANACCSPAIGSCKKEVIAFCAGSANFPIAFSSQCSDGTDTGRYLNAYYVR